MEGNKFWIIFGSVMMAAVVLSAIFVFIALDATSGAPQVVIDGVTMNGITDKQLNDLLTPMVALLVFVLICAIITIAYGIKNKAK